MSKEKSGVIYVATGDRYWDEMVRSLKSLKESNPHVKVTVFTDRIRQEMDEAKIVVLQSPQFSFYDKWQGIMHSPYFKTLYLDTDTYVCGDLSPFFTMLDYFDVLVSLDVTYSKRYLAKHEARYGIPKEFPILQAGVIGFSDSEGFHKLVQTWEEVFWKDIVDKDGVFDDQAALRVALYLTHSVRFAVLPYEFNMRLSGPVYFVTLPRILHTNRSPNFIQKFLRQASRFDGCRTVYVPHIGFLAGRRDMIRVVLEGVKGFLKGLMGR